MANRPGRVALALVGALAAGLTVFGSGLVIARKATPEFAAGRIPSRPSFQRAFQTAAQHLGYVLVEQEPEFRLFAWTRDLKALGRLEQERQRDWIVRNHRQFVIEVSQRAYRGKTEGRFLVQLGLDGRPWLAQWGALRSFFRSGPVPEGSASELLPLARLMISERETLVAQRPGFELGSFDQFSAVVPAKPAQYVYAQVAGTIAHAVRSVGTASAQHEEHARLGRFARRLGLDVLVLFAATGLCIRSAMKGRIRWRAGLCLAFAGMVISVFSITEDRGQDTYFLAFAVAIISNLLVLAVWVAGESFSSGLQGNPTAALEEAMSRRIGSLAGPEIVAGLAMGLGIGGLRWLTLAYASWSGSLWLRQGSVLVQSSEHNENFFSYGVLLAGLVLLADAAAALVRTPYFWGSAAAATGLLGLYSAWGPWYVAPWWELPVALALLWMTRHYGVLGTLTASVVATTSLPFALAISYPGWMLAPIVVGAAVASVAAAGVAGSIWRRKERERLRPVPAYRPCFISYSGKDGRFVNKLERALVRRGVRCWLDSRSALLGDKVFGSIYKAIFKDSEVTIVCCSAHSLSSIWVQRELDMVMAREEQLHNAVMAGPRSDVKVPPVMIPVDLDGEVRKGGSEYAILLASRSLADFRGWDREPRRFEVGVEALVNRLLVVGGRGAGGDGTTGPPDGELSPKAPVTGDADRGHTQGAGREGEAEPAEVIADDIRPCRCGKEIAWLSSSDGTLRGIEIRRGIQVNEEGRKTSLVDPNDLHHCALEPSRHPDALEDAGRDSPL